MNSEYAQSSSRENSVEQRKSMKELKRMNQPNSASANTPTIVIRCDLPQAMSKLMEQADGMNWELEEIRKTLPSLRTHTDLASVQNTLVEMQRSLTEMNKLLERVDPQRYADAFNAAVQPLTQAVRENMELTSQRQSQLMNDVADAYIRRMDDAVHGQFDHLKITLEDTCRYQEKAIKNVADALSSFGVMCSFCQRALPIARFPLSFSRRARFSSDIFILTKTVSQSCIISRDIS